jgi:hypothetical protein
MWFEELRKGGRWFEGFKKGGTLFLRVRGSQVEQARFERVGDSWPMQSALRPASMVFLPLFSWNFHT